LYIKELDIHLAVTLGGYKLVLCHSACAAWPPRLCCAGPLAAGQAQQQITAEEPGGSPNSVLGTTPLMWPCIYPKL